MDKRTTGVEQLAFDLRAKRCPQCERDLPGWDFVQDSSRKSGLASYCKPCWRIKCNARYAREPEVLRARTRAWARAHKDKRAEIKRRHYWANLAKCQEADRVSAKRWRDANVQIHRDRQARRRAKIHAATIVPFTASQLKERWAYYGDRCWMCRALATATDHVKPLAKGGAHMLCNLRPVCKSCNSRKRDHWPFNPDLVRNV